MTTYLTELRDTKQFTGNVVIKMAGRYFSTRQPDSGLTVNLRYRHLVKSLIVNPTVADPRRVGTTIASYSFVLTDRYGSVSRLVKGDGRDLVGTTVEIWIGRSGIEMPFANYFKLPDTKLRKIGSKDGTYTFSTTEETERMNRAIFTETTRLSGDILSGTTTITALDDISAFPSTGYFRVDREIIGYASKNNTTKTFSGCTRGEFGTDAAAHDIRTDCYHCDVVEDNPLNILMMILTSGGGGSAYDTLASGLAIDQNLINISAIESIRDELFEDVTFRLPIFNVTKALELMEKELLEPCKLRFTTDRNSKITLAVLDRAQFVEQVDVIDADTLAKIPETAVDEAKLVNKIVINWGYNLATEKFEERSTFTDSDSIADYGEKDALTLSFKGVQSDLAGEAFVEAFAAAMLDRLSTPKPEVSITTHIDKSLLSIGDKSQLITDKIANSEGRLRFAEDLEVVSRSINYQTGDVILKLAFTSYTGLRLCYIAPSDTFNSVASDTVGSLSAGRGDAWNAGWKCRLWDNVANEYATDQVNEIASIDGDEITFTDAWDVTLTANHRLKFPDFDDATTEQRRYCFTSINNQDFSNDEKQYKIAP